MAEAVGHSLIEAADGVIALAAEGVDAGAVVEHAGVGGIERESATGPGQGAFAVPQFHQAPGAEVKCTRVVGVEFEMALHDMEEILEPGIGLFVATEATQRRVDEEPALEVVGTHPAGLAILADGVLVLALLEGEPGGKVVALKLVGVELGGPIEQMLRLGVVLAQRLHQSAGRDGLGEIGIQLQRLPAVGLRPLEIGVAGIPVHVEIGAAVGGAGVGAGIRRVRLDGTLEHAAGELDAAAAELVEVLAAAQVVVVGLDIGLLRLADGALLLVSQHATQRLDDVARDLVLDGEHVLQLPVVALGPELVAVGDIHQLGGEAQHAPGLANAALEDGVDLELLADGTDVLAFSLEGKGRGARCHPKCGHPGEGVDDFLGDAVGEVLVVGIGAHVEEREHRNGLALLGDGHDPAAGRRRGAGVDGQGLGHERRGGIAGLGLALERARHGALQILGEIGANRAHRRGALEETLGDDGLGAGAAERRLPGEHLEQHAAEAVDVAASVGLILAGGLLRTDVCRRAEGGAGLGEVLGAGGDDRLGDAEIGDEGLALVEHHVLGLDVAMNDLLAMGVVERGGDIARDLDGIGHRQRTLTREPRPQ